MRRLLVPFLLAVAGLFTSALRVSAQPVAPTPQWDRSFGSSGEDILRGGQQTSDGGTILGGTSPSVLGGDKTQPGRGGDDYWLVKLDANGAKQWDRTFGGTGDDQLYAVQQTSDGGYLLGGTSLSPVSGDKTQPVLSPGIVDYWVIKLDANGTKQWDRTFGGSSVDVLKAVQQTSDGGYLLGGQSSSPVSGDKTQPGRGLDDYWVIKLDANGTKQWDRTFGGGHNDFLGAAQQTPDGGYLLAGGSLSPTGGDKTQPHQGGGDCWVVKLDASGTKQWDRTFGGRASDYVTALQLTGDGGSLLGGYSDSPISDDKTQPGQGYGDYWAIKLDASGAKQWDRTLGGADYDYLYALKQTRDGGYLLGGYSASPVGGDKTHPGQGGYDYWLVKLDASGTKQWDQAVGGPGGDYLYALEQTGDGGYLLGGYSASGIGGDKTQASRGGLDYWLVKLAPAPVPTWTGALSTDWFTAGNWTGGVPNASLDALIPAGAPRYPLLAAGTARAKTLTMNAGSALTHTGGTLALDGDWVNHGTYHGVTPTTGGTVELSGPAAHTLGGTSQLSLYHLQVGSGGATQTGAVEIVRVLSLAGTLRTNGNPLTLLSSARGDALVNNNGGVVMGTATVQRYIDPSQNAGPGYRQYSSPVSNTTVGDLATSTGFTPVVNSAYNTSPTPSTVNPFPTVFGYDQSRLTVTSTYAPFDKGWFSPNAPTDPLVVGRGYTVNRDASQLVDFTGTLNNGAIPLPPLASNRSTYIDGGWHLLGNPYPSPFDYSRVAPADRPGLDAAIHVFSSTSQYGGQYSSHVNGVGGNPVIPSGQGFFVRVAAGQASGSFTFRNSHRLTTPDATTFQRPTVETRPLVQLTLRGATGVASDEAYVYAEAGATVGFDSRYDAVKLLNSNGLNLSLTAAGEELAINGLPAFAPGTVVPLSVGVPVAGDYRLRVAQLLNLPAGAAAVLVDTQLNTRTELATLPAAGYAFSVTSAQAATLITGRFYLNLGATALATAAGRAVTALQLYPNPVHGGTATLTGALPGTVITVHDALGRAAASARADATGTAALELPAGLAPGVYVVRAGTQALRLTVD